MPFTKFPSIENFGNVFRNMNRRFNPDPVTYNAKIKLHGTNAGVRIYPDGKVVAQSRSRDITPEDDNAGFASWVRSNEDAFRTCGIENTTVIFFGEWAGPGIQKGDAVTKLDRKYFFVFAIQFGDEVVTEPWTIEHLVPELDDVVVLPWHFEDEVTVDFTKPDESNVFIDRVNETVEQIGERDPFIQEMFDIEGPGEGLVFMPISMLGMPRDEFAILSWKAKAEAHRVKKASKAVTSRLEVPEGVAAYVEAFVTPARCKQALSEACDGIAERPRTSAFLKWMGNDIRKESVAELEEMGLEWKQVASHVNKASVQWFMRACEEIT